MSKYGIDYYGTAYYGANTAVQFSATNFAAQSRTYGQIQLSWGTPTGSWDYIRLVRNSYGYPVSADDGDLLFEQANPGVTFYLDNGQAPRNVGLKQGHVYYYTLFVRETVHNTWQNAGTATGVAVKDYNTTQSLMDYLPSIVKSNIPYDTSLDSNNDFLYRFLKLFAFQLDLYKTQTENISNRYDVANLDGRLIPRFMEQFGITYEPYIGLKQSRIFLRNIARLYQNKGTLSGTREFIKAYAGYDNKIVLGKNLMLDQNDSSFEQSIGSWASVSNATLAQHLATDSPTITPYKELASQPDFYNLQKATLQVTAVASANTTIALSGDNPIHYGIPVQPALPYTFTAYSQAGSTGRAVSAQIYWYDSTGAALTPSTVGSTTTNTTGAWRRVTSSVTSPAGAAFAVPYIKIASTAASEVHYFDCLQFEQSSSATFFQDARQMEITLIANRINEILNPNFESSTGNWTFTNCTATLSSNEVGVDPDAPSVSISGGSVEVYPSAAGLVTVASSAMPIFANNDYTFSVYAFDDTSSYPFTPSILWYDASSTLISTSTGSALTSQNVWARPFVTGIAPDNAVTAKVELTWTATSALDGIYLDAALFEKSAFVNSYFDGNTGVTELSDLFWEGTANASRSHYYRNRFAVQSRLVAKIPDWSHFGSTFELFFAQPNT